jgi:hypothetical protein
MRRTQCRLQAQAAADLVALLQRLQDTHQAVPALTLSMSERTERQLQVSPPEGVVQAAGGAMLKSELVVTWKDLHEHCQTTQNGT